MLLEELNTNSTANRLAQPDGRTSLVLVGFFETGRFLRFVNNVENEQALEGQNQLFQKCRKEIEEGKRAWLDAN